jgi:D-tyrosyl-tRNA(Tyr) deacylase
MRVILQRVLEASVTIENTQTHKIGKGLVALVGFGAGDTDKEADCLALKMAELRVFADEKGSMNLSLLDIGGSALLVPNFTLYANCKKGRRPSFTDALPPKEASPLFDYFTGVVKEKIQDVKTGVFGADMRVDIINDGPVTIILDSFEIMTRRA